MAEAVIVDFVSTLSPAQVLKGSMLDMSFSAITDPHIGPTSFFQCLEFSRSEGFITRQMQPHPQFGVF